MSEVGAMLRDDWIALLLSALAVGLVIGAAEWLRHRGLSRDYSRKIVHVGIGSWVGPTYVLYDHQLMAVVPPLVFVLVNVLSYRLGLLRSIEGEERNIGTILYPLSVSLALALFWGEQAAIGLSSILVLAWGDAAASLVGRRWGRHRYRVFFQYRSYEGSAAMGVMSFVAVLVAHAWLGAPLSGVVTAALAVAAVATLVEARSIWGLDNLLVPAVTAGTLVLIGGAL